jgi:putative membrane protein
MALFAKRNLALKHALFARVTLLALGLPFAGAHAADTVSAADRSFIAMVSQGGMFEVEAGGVGASQGSTQDIRDQGTTEQHDHQLVGEKLKSIASSVGITFPGTLSPAFQKELDDLKAASGPAFDALYLKDMEDVHAKDGAAFAKEAASGTNPDLRSFASETHRIVLRHIGELKAVGPGGK